YRVSEPGEPFGAVAIRPAAAVLRRARKLPHVENGDRRDVSLEKRVDEGVVEIQPLVVHRAIAVGDHARPRDRELVGAEAELLHQRDVVAIAVVVVGGYVAGRAVDRVPRGMGEAVLYRRRPAVGERRALDLVG